MKTDMNMDKKRIYVGVGQIKETVHGVRFTAKSFSKKEDVGQYSLF